MCIGGRPSLIQTLLLGQGRSAATIVLQCMPPFALLRIQITHCTTEQLQIQIETPTLTGSRSRVRSLLLLLLSYFAFLAYPLFQLFHFRIYMSTFPPIQWLQVLVQTRDHGWPTQR